MAKKQKRMILFLIIYTLFLIVLMFIGLPIKVTIPENPTFLESLFYRFLLSVSINRGVGEGIKMLNLIPFNILTTLTSLIALRNLIANIVLFIPFGLLGGVTRRPLLKFLVAIVCIEILQLLTHRGICDIDDVMLNTLGCWIGLILYDKFMKKKVEDNQ